MICSKFKKLLDEIEENGDITSEIQNILPNQKLHFQFGLAQNMSCGIFFVISTDLFFKSLLSAKLTYKEAIPRNWFTKAKQSKLFSFPCRLFSKEHTSSLLTKPLANTIERRRKKLYEPQKFQQSQENIFTMASTGGTN